MRRTLLVTNDFPPRQGGIQNYLHTLVGHLPTDDLVVYAPAWPHGAEPHPAFDARQPFPVYRHPTSLMLPTRDVARRAADILRAERCAAVWFGASAPLALMTPYLRRAGATRVLASTHGHEVGWSMLPGARQALRRIGSQVDVLTFVSRYCRSRFASAFGPMAALEYVPPGVDADVFRPDPVARATLRARYGLGERPTIVCVSRLVPRKGQDMLIRALPLIRRQVPDAVLLLVGGGPDGDRLTELARTSGVAEHVVCTGSVPAAELAGHYAAGDVFAMPSRTRGRGLDVEAFGLVYLEASATGLPVVAGRSGGAPETVRDGVTGHVVDGRQAGELADVLIGLLTDHERAAKMGDAGRQWAKDAWDWQSLADRLRRLLDT